MQGWYNQDGISGAIVNLPHLRPYLHFFLTPVDIWCFMFVYFAVWLFTSTFDFFVVKDDKYKMHAKDFNFFLGRCRYILKQYKFWFHCRLNRRLEYKDTGVLHSYSLHTGISFYSHYIMCVAHIQRILKRTFLVIFFINFFFFLS